MITELSQALLVIFVFFASMATIFAAVVHAESGLHKSAEVPRGVEPTNPAPVAVAIDREAADRLAA